jgi:homocysteine S-methyltransferase
VDLRARLERPEVVVMDGGMGTTVQDRGIDVRNHLWGSAALLSDAGRALNDAVHRDFLEAGAELLIANTHSPSLGASAEYLEHAGTDAIEEPLRQEILALAPERRARRLCERVNDEAVASLRRAVGARLDVVIAGCVSSPKPAYASEGPSADVVYERLVSQAEILAGHRLDLMLFELLTTAGDVEGSARIATALGLERLAIGLTCGDDGRTLGGVSMQQAVELAAAAAPLVYFVQCTRYDVVERALAALLEAVDGAAAVGVYANDARIWKRFAWHGARVSPAAYGEAAQRWRDMGARLIGGCCGTGPEHVAELCRRL